MLAFRSVGNIVKHPLKISVSFTWVTVLLDKSLLPCCFAGCGMCDALWSRQPKLNLRVRHGTKARGDRQTGENHCNPAVLLEYKKMFQNAALNYFVISQDPKITTFQLVK